MNAHVLLMFLFGCGGNQNPPYVAPMEVPAPDPNDILNEDSLPPPVAGGAPPEPSGSPVVADVDAPIDQPAVSFALS